MEKSPEQTWAELQGNLLAAAQDGLKIQRLCNEVMTSVIGAILAERDLLTRSKLLGMTKQNDHVRNFAAISVERQKLMETVGAGVTNNLFDPTWIPSLCRISDGLRSCAVAILYDALQISTNADFKKEAQIFLNKLDVPMPALSPNDPVPTHRHNSLQ